MFVCIYTHVCTCLYAGAMCKTWTNNVEWFLVQERYHQRNHVCSDIIFDHCVRQGGKPIHTCIRTYMCILKSTHTLNLNSGCIVMMVTASELISTPMHHGIHTYMHTYIHEHMITKHIVASVPGSENVLAL